MFHDRRTWVVVDVDGPEHLAEKLTAQTWCLCNGFRLAGYLFLNDATHEDGAQEYGIVREADGRQVETVTFSWCNRARAEEHIRLAIAGEYAEDLGRVPPERIQTPAEHGRCRYCA